ncbi:MAG: coagulation factor 5/8 type domain protein [Eubacterium sp.]|jgi:hypothetical protein|nr:coagulation factor 5/8 type domain protein [Eubacterium sp.]
MKNRKLMGILQILIILSLGIAAITYVLDDGTGKTVEYDKGQQNGPIEKTEAQTDDGKITIVTSPGKVKAETPVFANESTPGIEDLGQNLALNKTVSDNGFNDVYEAKNVTDGIPQTYWEGKPAAYPNIITVDLGTSKSISKVRVRLNPEVVWSKRTQNFSVLSSADGKVFKEAAVAGDYDFDPKTGNMVLVILDKAVETQYVQLQFTKNTGASAAQISEFEVY